MRFVVCLLLLLAALPAHCAVTITDTVYTPFSGVLFSGRISVTGPNINTADNRTVAKWTVERTVTSGVFTVTLEPTDSGTVQGYYTVTYRPSVGTAWNETWVVPTTVSILKINQVRVASTPTTNVSVNLAQLAASGAVSGDSLVYNGTSWVPSTAPEYYSETFTGVATVTIPASTHGFYTPNLLVTCYDNSSPAKLIDVDVSVEASTYEVVLVFAVAQSGTVIIAGSSQGSSPFYSKAFTSATSVSITAAEHGLTTSRLFAQCYDAQSPAHQVEGLIEVDSSTLAVTVSFAAAQSGRCVVGGR